MNQLIDELNDIKHQRYILVINDVYNNSIKSKLNDLLFELNALKNTLDRKYENPEDIFEWLDRIVEDFEDYISKWLDVKYLNYYQHMPYSYDFDVDKLKIALQQSKRK